MNSEIKNKEEVPVLMKTTDGKMVVLMTSAYKGTVVWKKDTTYSFPLGYHYKGWNPLNFIRLDANTQVILYNS